MLFAFAGLVRTETIGGRIGSVSVSQERELNRAKAEIENQSTLPNRRYKLQLPEAEGAIKESRRGGSL